MDTYRTHLINSDKKRAFVEQHCREHHNTQLYKMLLDFYPLFSFTIDYSHKDFCENWGGEMDKWNWKITTKRGRMQNTFITGMGYRQSVTSKTPLSLKYTKEALEQCRDTLILSHKNGTYTLVQEPSLAEVLFCTLMDASNSIEPFVFWCSGFGYSSDSRKALADYLECQKLYVDLFNVFTSQQLDQMRELLADF